MNKSFVAFDMEHTNNTHTSDNNNSNSNTSADVDSNGHEYIESSEPVPLLWALLQSPKLRLFSYLCGVSAPDIGWEMTWYQILISLWVWFVRSVYAFFSVTSVISNMVQVETSKITLFQKIAYIFYSIKLSVVYLVLFDIYIRKRPYYTFKKTNQNRSFLQIDGLLKEAVAFIVVFVIFDIIVAASLANASSSILVFIEIFCQMLPIYFIYFFMAYEFMYIENVLQHELLEPVKQGNLTLNKYKGVRAFVDAKVRSHMISFSTYSLLTLLSCFTLIFSVYSGIANNDNLPIIYSISYLYLFLGKDLIVMALIIWRISRINEKSRGLSLLIADTKPSLEMAYVFIQNNTRPIVYKIFGLISIYETEMLLSFAGYVASFAAAMVDGGN